MPKLLSGQVARFTFSGGDVGRVQFMAEFTRKSGTHARGPLEASLGLPFLRRFGAARSDLLRVILAVHAADCATRRPGGSKNDPHGWNRRFELDIPVSDLSTWRSVTEELQDFLIWLTEDSWTLRFSELRSPNHPRHEQLSFAIDPRAVALFSGGLDSLAGYMIDRLDYGLDLYPLSVATNTLMSGLQNRVLSQVCTKLGPAKLSRACAFMRLPWRADSSQRTRGLVYLGLASLVAATIGSSQVRVYENGVGAINLPLLQSQVGTMSSRSVHPKTLHLFGQLVQKLLGTTLKYELPFLFWTKGKMVERLIDLNVEQLIEGTRSCDFVTRRHAPCMNCTSCLLTRIATRDRFLVPGEDALTRGNGQVWRYAMQTHVTRLDHALAFEDPWRGLVQVFPELWVALQSSMSLSGLNYDQARLQITEMYRRFVSEWKQFVAGRLNLADK